MAGQIPTFEDWATASGAYVVNNDSGGSAWYHDIFQDADGGVNWSRVFVQRADGNPTPEQTMRSIYAQIYSAGLPYGTLGVLLEQWLRGGNGGTVEVDGLKFIRTGEPWQNTYNIAYLSDVTRPIMDKVPERYRGTYDTELGFLMYGPMAMAVGTAIRRVTTNDDIFERFMDSGALIRIVGGMFLSAFAADIWGMINAGTIPGDAAEFLTSDISVDAVDAFDAADYSQPFEYTPGPGDVDDFIPPQMGVPEGYENYAQNYSAPELPGPGDVDDFIPPELGYPDGYENYVPSLSPSPTSLLQPSINTSTAPSLYDAAKVLAPPLIKSAFQESPSMQSVQAVAPGVTNTSAQPLPGGGTVPIGSTSNYQPWGGTTGPSNAGAGPTWSDIPAEPQQPAPEPEKKSPWPLLLIAAAAIYAESQ